VEDRRANVDGYFRAEAEVVTGNGGSILSLETGDNARSASLGVMGPGVLIAEDEVEGGRPALPLPPLESGEFRLGIVGVDVVVDLFW
jgi:hypothetical protein